MYDIPNYGEPLIRKVVTDQMLQGFEKLFEIRPDGHFEEGSVKRFMEGSDFLSGLMDKRPVKPREGDSFSIQLKMKDAGVKFVSHRLESMYRKLRDPDKSYIFNEFGELLINEMILALQEMPDEEWEAGARTTEEEIREVRSFFSEVAKETAEQLEDWTREDELAFIVEMTTGYTDFRCMGINDGEGDVIFYDSDFCFLYEFGVDALWKVLEKDEK